MEIILKKAIDFEGRKIEKVNLDLDSLTGNDMQNAERQYFSTGGQMGNVAGGEYCSIVASIASGEPIELFKVISALDYNNITSQVQAFLLGMASLNQSLMTSEEATSKSAK